MVDNWSRLAMPVGSGARLKFRRLGGAGRGRAQGGNVYYVRPRRGASWRRRRPTSTLIEGGFGGGGGNGGRGGDSLGKGNAGNGGSGAFGAFGGNVVVTVGGRERTRRRDPDRTVVLRGGGADGGRGGRGGIPRGDGTAGAGGSGAAGGDGGTVVVWRGAGGASTGPTIIEGGFGGNGGDAASGGTSRRRDVTGEDGGALLGRFRSVLADAVARYGWAAV